MSLYDLLDLAVRAANRVRVDVTQLLRALPHGSSVLVAIAVLTVLVRLLLPLAVRSVLALPERAALDGDRVIASSGGCFETGGPDWLFALTLGAFLAALTAGLHILAMRSDGSRLSPELPRLALRWRLLAYLAAVVEIPLLGLPWLNLALLLGPNLVVQLAARRRAHPAAAVPGVGQTLGHRRRRLVLCALCVISTGAGLGTLAGSLLLGGPC